MLKLTIVNNQLMHDIIIVLKIIKMFITSNNKRIGKILFNYHTIEWEIEQLVTFQIGHILVGSPMYLENFTSTQLLPNASMMASKIFD